MIPQVYTDMNLESFIDVSTEETSGELPLLKEYDFDFKANRIRFKDGKPIILEGLEALMVQNQKAILTERFKYLGYSWNYGCEIKSLIGKVWSNTSLKTEGKRLIEECLLVNPYNISVDEVKVTIDGRKVSLYVKINTVYGEAEINV